MDPGESYDWYVEVDGEEDSETFTSSTWSFDVVDDPDIEMSSANLDGVEDVDLETDLNVQISQDDDLETEAEFFVCLEGFSSRSECFSGALDSFTGSGTETLTINTDDEGFDLDPETNYEWFIEAYPIGEYELTVDNEENPWSFKTVEYPEIQVIDPDDVQEVFR